MSNKDRDKVLSDLEALRRMSDSTRANADLEAFRHKAQAGQTNILAFLRKHKDASRDVLDTNKGGAKATGDDAAPPLVAGSRTSAGKPKTNRQRQAGDLLNEHDVAAALSVSVQTIRRWRMFRLGPTFYKVGFHVRYKAEEVTAWLNEQQTGGDQPKKGK